MDNNNIILHTKTSQINNFVYFFLNLLFFAILIFFSANIINIFSTLFLSINDLTVEKPENIVNLIAQSTSWVVISIPLFLIVWRFLRTHLKTYTFTNDRLVYKYGILNKNTDYIELFRIKDFHFSKPLFLRPFGLSHFHIISTDRRFPHFTIKAVKNAESYENEIRDQIEKLRLSGKGREIDVV